MSLGNKAAIQEVSVCVSVCVCTQSICKTVIGAAFLALVLRNTETLKKLSLFRFPLWLCCEGQEQPGLQERAEAEKD